MRLHHPNQKCDGLIGKRAINALYGHRCALRLAVVTGKIDVTGMSKNG